jgi:MFS family permease
MAAISPAPDAAVSGFADKKARFVAWLTVAVLLVMATLSYLDRQIISLMVEPIRADLGVGDFEIGLLQGVAFGAFYALCGLPLGWMVDRFSRRWIIFGGITLWSIATTTCGLASQYWQLLLSRFGVGVGEAALAPAAYSMMADRFPRHRLTLAISVFGLGTVLGSMLAFVLGGLLIGHFGATTEFAIPLFGNLHGWQLVFLIVGLPGILLGLLIFIVPEPVRTLVRHKRDERGEIVESKFVDFLRSNARYFTCHFLGFSCLGIQAYATGAWLPALMMRRFEIGPELVGPLMGLVLVAGAMPGFIWSGWFIDRWYARGTVDAHLRYFVYTCIGSATVSVIAYGFVTSLWLLIVLAILLQFVLPITGGAAAHLQIVTPSQFRGRVSALFMLFFNLIGMCVGPTSVGFLTDYVFHDPRLVNVSLAIVYAVSGLLASALLFAGLGAARRAVAEVDLASREEEEAEAGNSRPAGTPIGKI